MPEELARLEVVWAVGEGEARAVGDSHPRNSSESDRQRMGRGWIVAGKVNDGRVGVCSLPVFFAQCPKRKLFLHFVCSLKKFLKTKTR